MKHMAVRRLSCLLLALVLILSLIPGLSPAASAATLLGNPTGYTKASDVPYKKSGSYVLNWGARGETACFLTSYAQSYYTGSYTYQKLAANKGSAVASGYTTSPLYTALRGMVRAKQSNTTTYNGTRDLYKYTDCVNSNDSYISSFYSGARLSGKWDSGATWNREHTWPKSKTYDDKDKNQNADLMMLRPTATSENSSRGNLAYGESSGFYHPNSEAGSTGLDLRGDCARILLYCYVRWDNQSYMWGASGVMENLDVLLSWMAADPVDTWEMGRNDAVQSITGVRNCFVDFPELAWLLFAQAVPAGYPTPSNGGKTEDPCKDGHAWDEGKVSTQPSCTDKGVKTFTCTRCGETRTEELAALGHDFTVSGKGASCTEAGSVTFTCTRCGYSYEEPSPALGHDYKTINVPAGCTQEGKTVVECARCGDVKSSEILPALGHDWDAGVVTLAPSCVAEGVKTFTCSRCKETRSEELPKIPHSWGPAEEYSPAREGHKAVYIRICTVCGETLYTDSPTEFRFEDVQDPSRFYFTPVYWAVDHTPAITKGVTDTLFVPEDSCTRAQVVTFLWRAAGAPPAEAGTELPFEDVSPNAYYAQAVLWAVGNGITAGMDSTHFEPNGKCTRGQVVTFLWRAAGEPAAETEALRFEDVPAKAFYAKAVLWAVEQGITKGMDKTHFDPSRVCTRGQVVTFLWRAETED